MSNCRRWFATLVVVGAATLGAAVPAPAQIFSSPTRERNLMVDNEIVGAGIKNPRVIEALRNTPRHEFVTFGERSQAYLDMALPIGEGQTISPPFIVAFMTEQIDPQPTDVVLEIGTGSGYQAAVLSPLCKEVYTIEIKEPLGQAAARVLKKLNYKNVFPKIGDGYQGWPEHAPFDKIIVTCSPENVPKALVDQLREGGRLIVPVGERYQQTLYMCKKENGQLLTEALRPTLFVPMTGTAESLRKVKPDPLRPTIVNGSFEESAMEGKLEIPRGWHYVRQATLVADKLSPDGERYLTFNNADPGRGAQAWQGFAVDGRKVPLLDVSLRVKGANIRPGRAAIEMPMLRIVFYDEKQKVVGDSGIGPWRGSFDWQDERKELKVPPRTDHATIGVGLWGGVGEVSFDAVKVEAAK